MIIIQMFWLTTELFSILSRFLFQHGQPNNKLDLSADKTDECLLQNVFITHYEQQRGELIARRQFVSTQCRS